MHELWSSDLSCQNKNQFNFFFHSSSEGVGGSSLLKRAWRMFFRILVYVRLLNLYLLKLQWNFKFWLSRFLYFHPTSTKIWYCVWLKYGVFLKFRISLSTYPKNLLVKIFFNPTEIKLGGEVGIIRIDVMASEWLWFSYLKRNFWILSHWR